MFVECKICNKFIHKVPGKIKVIKSDEDKSLYDIYTKDPIVIGDILCGSCRLLPYNTGTSALVTLSSAPSTSADSISVEDESNDLDVSEPDDSDFTVTITKNEEYMYVDMQRVVSTHKYCFICGSTKNLKRIPLEARCYVFRKTNIFIPENNRCCQIHMIGNNLFEDELLHLRVVSHVSKISASDVNSFLNTLSKNANMSLFDKMSQNNMSEDQLKILTGLTWKNVTELENLFTSMRNTNVRSITQALIIFLFKLRTGISNKVIASVLGLPREQQVSSFFNEVLEGFEKDVLPLFGLNSVSREYLLINTTVTARKLLNLKDDQLVLIFDGTYIKHQKSENNAYQRKSYSVQKKTHLCKPFTICTTNGFIVDFVGPFYATQNDATIIKEVLQNQDLKSLLRPNDIFIVDRGFRDAINYITKQGYTVHMPALKGNRPQLSTEEANMSRRVTKLRWVVEAVHGAIAQKYQLLHHCLDNKILPKIKLLCKAAGFLQNQFGRRLSSDGSLADTIVDYMDKRMHVSNSLREEVEENKWNRRRTSFKQLVASELLDFPRLNKEQLKIIFTGSYHLSLAISYLAEIIDEKNNICVHYVKQTPNIIKLDVRSRHISNKTYRVYIDYIPNSTEINGIHRYCCDCPNGNRTVGCCAHVASVIYYLAHGRYLSRIIRPAEILSNIFSTDNIHVVINDNSDDDD